MQIVEASYPSSVSRKKVGGAVLEQNDSCVISGFCYEVDENCVLTQKNPVTILLAHCIITLC